MTTKFCQAVALACAAIACTLGGMAPPAAATDIRFTLDWKFEGPAAPFFVAIDKGYFKAEGLNVTIDTGAGSRESIPRVATGTYQMGFGDINSLVKAIDEQPDLKAKAVMMVYERPPFAIIGRKSLGVTTDPKSLEGKTLGAPPPDGAFAQWKAFAQVAKLDLSKIKIESVGFPVREPMLAQGKVQGIFGFSFSSVLNLKAQGVKADDISLILMAENGLDLYGNAILVNSDFASSNADAVKGFLRAFVKALKDVAKDPAGGVDAVLKRNNIVKKDVELERLKMALQQNFITPAVKKNGFGGVEEAKMKTSIDLLKVSIGLKAPPAPARVFDGSYLGPADQRKVD